MNQESEHRGGALYEAATEELTGPNPSPEDRSTSEEMLAGRVEELTQQHGEVKGHIIYEGELLDLIRTNREKLLKLLEEKKI